MECDFVKCLALFFDLSFSLPTNGEFSVLMSQEMNAVANNPACDAITLGMLCLTFAHISVDVEGVDTPEDLEKARAYALTL